MATITTTIVGVTINKILCLNRFHLLKEIILCACTHCNNYHSKY